MADLVPTTSSAFLAMSMSPQHQPLPSPEPLLTDYIIEKMRCFLCDHDFQEGEEPWLIFEKRVQEDGLLECPLSVILSSALGRELDEETAHSKILCDTCNASVLEYESLEQRFYEMRFLILSKYNKMAKLNDLSTIAIEINGVLQTIEDIAEDEKSGTVNNCPPLNLTAVQREENVNHESTLDIVEQISFNEDSNAQTKAAGSSTVEKSQHSTIIIDANNKIISEEFVSINDGNVKYEVLEDEFAENIIDVEDIEEISENDMYCDIIELSSQVSQEDESSVASNYIEILPDQQKNCSEEIMYSSVMSETCVGEEVISTATSTQKRGVSRIPRQLKDSHPPIYEQQEGGSYICLLCSNRPHYNPQAFSEHMRTEHNYRFYTCDLCGNGFSRRQDLNDHMDEHHGSNEQGSFECETCQRIFANYRLFRIHKRMHYTNMKQFECTECHRKYGSKNLLDEHMNMHTGQRPYKCSQCPKDFASKYTLHSHAKIHTDRQRPYQCDVCDKAFLNQQNLTQHRKLHSGVKSFVCEICSKPFGTQHNLLVHKIVHSGNKPFICRTCGKAFARRAEIKDHERIHTGERPFQCNICQMAFAQRSNLTSHIKSTHFNEKQHKCEHCERTFKRRRLLDYHIQSTHTGERPHMCEICGASFVYPEHHKKHMIIHLGIKPFACEVCGKQFNSRDNRNAHRFVHSDKKPYECLECGAGFMRKPLLLAHMKQTKHSNDTIIVNQPQISLRHDATAGKVDDMVEETYSTTNSQAGDAENIAELYEDMMQRSECTLAVAENDDSNDVITRVSGQLIKDEIGDVKYLEFEELDDDGHQTLTWVDIGDKDSEVCITK